MILVLAGTGEARELAAMMAREEIAAEASLAGVTGRPEALDLPTRVGGFGGDVGFRAYLAGRHVRAVVDATHPFAAGISQRTARVCHELGIAYCLLRRPAWQAGSGDRWHAVSGAGDVAAITSDADNNHVIVVRHKNKLLTIYSNVANITVKEKQKVTRGQKIAEIPSGASPYVHFEVRKGLESTDPIAYLK